MIDPSIFHAVLTELAIGMLALAAICLVLCASSTTWFDQRKIDTLDAAAHVALMGGLFFLPFAVISGIKTSGVSGLEDARIVNKILFSFAAFGTWSAVLLNRLEWKKGIWDIPKRAWAHAVVGQVAFLFIIILGSIGGGLAKGGSLLDLLPIHPTFKATVILGPIGAGTLALGTLSTLVLIIKGRNGPKNYSS